MDATGARREYGIDAIRRGGASAPAGKSAVDEQTEVVCTRSVESGCLFDLDNDPSEEYNLLQPTEGAPADAHKDILAAFLKEALLSSWPPSDAGGALVEAKYQHRWAPFIKDCVDKGCPC